jgi:hypothetical protein
MLNSQEKTKIKISKKQKSLSSVMQKILSTLLRIIEPLLNNFPLLRTRK